MYLYVYIYLQVANPCGIYVNRIPSCGIKVRDVESALQAADARLIIERDRAARAESEIMEARRLGAQVCAMCGLPRVTPR